jgi:hypothetical protein
MKIPVLLLLCAVLSGCSLLGDIIKVVTPKPGGLGVAIQAPAGQNATVEIEGGSTKKSFQDDGRGFAIKLELDAGEYSVKPSVVDGYTASLSLTTTSGNNTVKGSTIVTVKSEQDVAVVIKYEKP